MIRKDKLDISEMGFTTLGEITGCTMWREVRVQRADENKKSVLHTDLLCV